MLLEKSSVVISMSEVGVLGQGALRKPAKHIPFCLAVNSHYQPAHYCCQYSLSACTLLLSIAIISLCTISVNSHYQPAH
jgi:hypothetical protein